MSKVMSRYLKQEFEVATYESMDPTGAVNVISHDALEGIVHNQVAAEVGLRYDYQDMLISDSHCVIRCTFIDDKGRRVQAIGESVPNTLETEIAKNYPALMASQRAFDRAAIRYFDFPGKVFSNMEGVDTPSVASSDTTIDVSDIPPVEEIPVAAPIRNDAPKAEPEKEAVEAPKEPPKEVVKAPSVETPKVAPATTASPDASAAAASDANDPGSVLCKIGRYTSKNLTIAQVYAESSGYIKWVVEKYNANTEETKKIQAACSEFLKRQEG